MLYPRSITTFINFIRNRFSSLIFQTIKLNKQYWDKKIPNLQYGTPNPLNAFSTDKEKFSDAMTTFNFAGVYKTTQSGRHAETQLYLKKHFINSPSATTILDIGASDGSTSLDFINLIYSYLKKYYVTDYNIKCTYFSHKGYTYFFNNAQTCFLVASKKFVFYPANKKLFNFLFKKKLDKLKAFPKEELLLINHDLKVKKQENQIINILEYNVFEPWSKEKVDIAVVGNLLNRAYFTDTQIKTALKNCYDALTENGILTVIRNAHTSNNEEIERSTIYKKDNKEKVFNKIHEINNGVEINEFILSLKF